MFRSMIVQRHHSSSAAYERWSCVQSRFDPAPCNVGHDYDLVDIDRRAFVAFAFAGGTRPPPRDAAPSSHTSLLYSAFCHPGNVCCLDVWVHGHHDPVHSDYKLSWRVLRTLWTMSGGETGVPGVFLVYQNCFWSPRIGYQPYCLNYGRLRAGATCLLPNVYIS